MQGVIRTMSHASVTVWRDAEAMSKGGKEKHFEREWEKYVLSGEEGWHWKTEMNRSGMP